MIFGLFIALSALAIAANVTTRRPEDGHLTVAHVRPPAWLWNASSIHQMAGSCGNFFRPKKNISYSSPFTAMLLILNGVETESRPVNQNRFSECAFHRKQRAVGYGSHQRTPTRRARHLRKLGGRRWSWMHQGWFGASGIHDQPHPTAICYPAFERRGALFHLPDKHRHQQASVTELIQCQVVRMPAAEDQAGPWGIDGRRHTHEYLPPSLALSEGFLWWTVRSAFEARWRHRRGSIGRLRGFQLRRRRLVIHWAGFAEYPRHSRHATVRDYCYSSSRGRFWSPTRSGHRQSRFNPYFAAIRSPDTWYLRSPSRHVVSGHANAATS